MADTPKSGKKSAGGISGPLRRCVICRKADQKDKLIRFVLAAKAESADPGAKNGWGIEIDPFHDKPGRGAYCHVVAACAGSRGLIDLVARSLVTGSGRSSGERPQVDRSGTILGLLEGALIGEKTGSGSLNTLARLRDEFAKSAAATDRRAGKGNVPKLRL